MNKEKEDTGKKSTKTPKSSVKNKSFFTDERIKFVIGILITGFALYLLLACVAYLFWWKTDLSIADSDIVSGSDIAVKNWSGKSGHFLAKMIINNGFGFGAFFIPFIFGTIGLSLLKFPNIKPFKLSVKFAFATIILSLILGFIFSKSNVYLGSGPGGSQGYHIIKWMNAFMGMIGTGVILTFLTVSFLVFAMRVKPESFGIKLPSFLKFRKHTDVPDFDPEPDILTHSENEAVIPHVKSTTDKKSENDHVEFVVRTTNQYAEDEDSDEDIPDLIPTGSIIRDFDNDPSSKPRTEEVPLDITRPDTVDTLPDHEVDRIMGDYDPRLDLSRYKFPPVSILKEHKSESAFDNTEVFENKENIIKTLGDHKIGIKSISATVGPTVTLYEIVPERGVSLHV